MWDDARQLNMVATMLAVLATAALSWGALAWVARQPQFAFHEVVVRGSLEHVSTARFEAVIRDDLAGTFFTMDLERARAALTRVPWVRSVALRRLWPQKLEVTVEEYVPYARWNETGLVNAQGEVFSADYDGALPRLEGPDARAPEVAARFREWGDALAPLALDLERIRLSPRGGWQLETKGAGGTLAIELGRDEPAVRLARFVAVYERTIGTLARVGTRVERVDLRYRNGFAAKVPGFRERAPKRRAAA
jgi:cell division protein FtsQ